MLKLTNVNILVIGDIIVDRYWYGNTTRISPEAPVPITHVTNVEDRAGGAANVALNIQALGGITTLVGIVGTDESSLSISKILDQHGIIDQLYRVDGIHSITKIRTITNYQQLIRADFEQDLSSYTQGLSKYLTNLSSYNLIVLSDYNKGTLQDCQAYIALAQKSSIPVLVDPKGADFTRYKGATLLTPNLSEFQAVVGPCATDDELIAKATGLIAELDLQAILITLSERGMLLVYRGAKEQECASLHYPTHSQEVFDVTGAGDTVIATLASSIASGYSLADAVNLANIAASVAIKKAGTAIVNHAELNTALIDAHQADIQFGVVSTEQLAQQVSIARARGEQIVMTNGCFDILHAGHIQYLEQASALGDKLVVAINTDESISKLKGESRPVFPLEQRLAMLAGLRSVAWVVVFEGDTPEKLLREIKPDILVKGGDYKNISEVVGHEIVSEYGGEIKLMAHIPGCSTTSTLDKLINQ
jgi:D-beta-D-heptose 7-phosphate kinase / D-beta-D-heptose 1-phosphate adenosyltransferase